MSKNYDGQTPDAAFIAQGRVYTEAGSATHGLAWRRDGVSVEEAKELIAEDCGLEPDKVLIGDEIPREQAAAVEAVRRTTSVSFNGNHWHSPWDPHAERAAREQHGDPNMN